MSKETIYKADAINAVITGAFSARTIYGRTDEGSTALHETVRAIKALPPAEPQWIPCSMRLPEEENGTYWVCTDTGYQCECRWTNVNHFWTDLTTNWHWHIMDIPQYTKVTAWMPLPEPYKGEQA